MCDHVVFLCANLQHISFCQAVWRYYPLLSYHLWNLLDGFFLNAKHMFKTPYYWRWTLNFIFIIINITFNFNLLKIIWYIIHCFHNKHYFCEIPSKIIHKHAFFLLFYLAKFSSSFKKIYFNIWVINFYIKAINIIVWLNIPKRI